VSAALDYTAELAADAQAETHAQMLRRLGFEAPDGSLPVPSGVKFFDAIQPERVDWVWPDYLPAGKLAILDGDPGLGKSTVTIDLAARVSRGDAMPDGSGRRAPGVVLLSSAEDGLSDTLRPRLDAAGANVSRVATLDVGDQGIVLPDDIARIKLAILSTGARLAILDPLMAYLSGRLKANSDQDVRQALAPVARLAEETGCSILVVRHLRKSDSATAVYRGGGSIGIIGQARIGLAVAQDPEDSEKRVLMVTKSNLGPIPASLSFGLDQWTGKLADGAEYGASRVVWHGRSDKTATDLLTLQDSQPAAPKVRPHEKAAKALRDILLEAGGALPAKEALGRLSDAGYLYVSRGSSVRALRAEAGVTSKKVGNREGSHWLWMVESDDE
jgi:hypothetical protein